jgi:site-specific DNA-cytosine methylase
MFDELFGDGLSKPPPSAPGSLSPSAPATHVESPAVNTPSLPSALAAHVEPPAVSTFTAPSAPATYVDPSAVHKHSSTSAPATRVDPPAVHTPERCSRKIVRNLSDMMGYTDDFLDELQLGGFKDAKSFAGGSDSDSDCLNRLADLMDGDTYSTSFSGIDAPGAANALLHHRLSKRLGTSRTLQLPRSLSMVEWDKEGQQELLVLCKRDDSCLFGDIAQFFRPELQDVVNMLKKKPNMAVEILGRIIGEGNAMTRVGWCLYHKRRCTLKTASRHVAGTSCVPFSKQGSQLGCADENIIYTLAWLGLRNELQEGDVTQENVDGFPIELFTRFMNFFYFLEPLVVDSTQFGSAGARKRLWIRARHKVKVLSQISPLSRFSQRFHRACAMSWKDFYFMHLASNCGAGVVQDEPQAELDWAQQRPNSKANGGARLLFKCDDAGPSQYAAALSQAEDTVKDEYEDRWPGEAHQLNQDPCGSHAMKSSKSCLHTLIHNCGLIFTRSVTPARWLFPTEMLAAQSFPVWPGLSLPEGLLLCSFNQRRDGRTCRAVCGQAGNSMNVMVAQVIQLHGYSCWKRAVLPKIFSNIRIISQAIKKHDKHSSTPSSATTASQLQLQGADGSDPGNQKGQKGTAAGATDGVKRRRCVGKKSSVD